MFKMHLLNIFLFSWFCSLVSLTAADGCGVVASASHLAHFRLRRAVGQLPVAHEPISIKVFMHILASSSQSEISTNYLFVIKIRSREVLCLLTIAATGHRRTNEGFESRVSAANITFNLASAERVINQSAINFDVTKEIELTDLTRHGNDSDLNIWWVESLGIVSSIRSPCLNSTEFHPDAIGSSPWYGPLIGYPSGVFIDYKVGPGASRLERNEAKTLVHEVGHWLGLGHTFVLGLEGLTN